jgi:hypothetical protein
MKIDTTIDLSELDAGDGYTIAELVANELALQIRAQVKKELKNDPKVAAVVRAIKEASIKKLMDEMKVSL